MAIQRLMPLAAIALCFLFVVVADAEEYALEVERIYEVGNEYALIGEAYSEDVTHEFHNGELIDEQANSVAIHLEGTLEVLEVDDQGEVTQWALSIATHSIGVSGREISLGNDRRILVNASPDAISYAYENGGRLGEDAETALHLLLGKVLTKIEDDTTGMRWVYQLAEPMSPGQRRATARADIDERLSQNGIDSEDAEVEQETHFVAYGQADFGMGEFDEKLAVVEMELDIEGFRFMGDFMPEYMSPESSRLQVVGGIALSLDPESRQGWNYYEMTMTNRLKGVDPGSKIEVAIDLQLHESYAYIIHSAQ